MADRLPDYLVVEGPIGAGKTRLCQRLAERLDAEALLERSEDNPFLERFYRNPREGAFPAQLFFLMQRAEQLSRLRQSDLFRPRRVADFLFAKDRLFARLNLDGHEFALYDRVWRTLAPEVPAPDLVIYLQAPAEVLLERLRARGRAGERSLDADYVESLAAAYVEFFHHYADSPLLIVNAAEWDAAGDEAGLERLLAEIRTARGGRHYFNPGSGAL